MPSVEVSTCRAAEDDARSELETQGFEVPNAQSTFVPRLASYRFPFPSKVDFLRLSMRLAEEEKSHWSAPLSRHARLIANDRPVFDFARTLGPSYTSRPQRPRDMTSRMDDFFGAPRPRHSALSDPSCQFELWIYKVLQTGKSRWSQVWVAYLVSEMEGDAAHVVPVVVKLFQECLFPRPHNWESRFEWRPAEIICHREAWAYDQLRSLQGTLVPHSYGFFNFVLPSGLSVVGHVLEYITGPSIFRYSRITGGRENTIVHYALMTAVIRAVYEIHSLGVANLDLRHEDIRIPKNSVESLVILDFDSARSLGDKYRFSGELVDPIEDDAFGIGKVCWSFETFKRFSRWLRQALSDPDTGEWMRQIFVDGPIAQAVFYSEEEMAQWEDSCEGDHWALSESDDDVFSTAV